MNKVAEILSREEVAALPQDRRPLNYRITSKMYHDVFEAVGTASMCWEPVPAKETFDSHQAEIVAVNLCMMLATELERLGVAPDRINPNAPPIPGEDLNSGVWFQAACSGLWYRSAGACGSVKTIRVNGQSFFPFSQ